MGLEPTFLRFSVVCSYHWAIQHLLWGLAESPKQCKIFDIVLSVIVEVALLGNFQQTFVSTCNVYFWTFLNFNVKTFNRSFCKYEFETYPERHMSISRHESSLRLDFVKSILKPASRQPRDSIFRLFYVVYL